MKIAISAIKPDLEAEVDARFGRCRHFIIVDPETREFEALDNTNTMAAGGAGVSTAQYIAKKGVEAVLTGNCGPNAYQVLSSSGIRVITGVSGMVKDALEGYRSGKFISSDSANVSDHFGAGANPGMGGELGMGRGRGLGHGMGKGMGSGRNQPARPVSQAQGAEELAALEAQLQGMARQLSDVQHRIEELEERS
jgi:predicted Fe-Mo cluster-binding NifX family protein